ncbi:hypothetical protein AB6805_30370 [Chitinophaga sp. RCC_12]|uniref:hypothetical protein n=1 Tax=Chitinophaga sp. RCC_12 TaxID=3239226 RepID=UPI003525666F
MKSEGIEILEIEILALRKIADKALAIIREGKKPSRAKAPSKKADGEADLRARILTGHLKPARLKKKKAS